VRQLLIGRFAERGEERALVLSIGVPGPQRQQGIDLRQRLAVFSFAKIGGSQDLMRSEGFV
jgi:hypothetical protein